MNKTIKKSSEPPFTALPNPQRTRFNFESNCTSILSQVESYVNRFSSLTAIELNQLKELIDERIAETYYWKENFMTHTELDNYIYIVYLDDGNYHYYFKGADAYKRYLEDDAVMVDRKTKDLFPVFETILVKEKAVA